MFEIKEVYFKFYRERGAHGNCLAIFCGPKGRLQVDPKGRVEGFGVVGLAYLDSKDLGHMMADINYIRNRTRKVSFAEVARVHPFLLLALKNSYGLLTPTAWGAYAIVRPQPTETPENKKDEAFARCPICKTRIVYSRRGTPLNGIPVIYRADCHRCSLSVRDSEPNQVISRINKLCGTTLQSSEIDWGKHFLTE